MPGVKAILPPTNCRRPPTSSPTSASASAPTEGREGAHQRAGLSGRADARGRRGGRTDGGRRHREHRDRVGAAAVRRRSAGEPAARGAPTRALEGNIWGTPDAGGAGPARRAAASNRGTEVDRSGVRRATRGPPAAWARRPTSGRTAISMRDSRTRRSCSTKPFVTPNTSHQTLETRIGDGVLAERQALHPLLGTQSVVQTVGSMARWLASRSGERRRRQRVHRRRIRQQGDRHDHAASFPRCCRRS